MTSLPFAEEGELRTFSRTVDPYLLQWHWDQQDREINVVGDTDWQFQFDNELPIQLTSESSFYIPAGVWHRLIKGTGDLTLKIIKHVTKS